MNGLKQLVPAGELRGRNARAGCEGVVQRIHECFISKLADLCITDKSANFDIGPDGRPRVVFCAATGEPARSRSAGPNGPRSPRSWPASIERRSSRNRAGISPDPGFRQTRHQGVSCIQAGKEEAATTSAHETASAVMFTMPRTVIVCVTTCAERTAPVTIGPMETPPPSARSSAYLHHVRVHQP